jgi:hypothetical protein
VGRVRSAYIDRDNKPYPLGVFLEGEPDDEYKATQVTQAGSLPVPWVLADWLATALEDALITEVTIGKHMNGIGVIRLVPALDLPDNPTPTATQDELKKAASEIANSLALKARLRTEVGDDSPADEVKVVLARAFTALLQE